MKKIPRTISIELYEDGSRTYLGDITIPKEFMDELRRLECDNPRLLKAMLKETVSKLSSLVIKSWPKL